MGRRRHHSVCWVAVAAALAAACGSTASAVTWAPGDIRTLLVPHGAVPTIDGAIEASEWADGAVTAMDDGTELRWLHADGFLYLGVRADAMGAANLVVAEGDQVRVLHSSAALGSAVYRRQEDGTWRLEHDFEWCCRSVSDAGSRGSLLENEGWVASTGYAGAPGHVEYRLMLGAPGLQVAVSYVSADGSVAFWPVDLPVGAREALHGVRRERAAFDVDTWVSLVAVD